MAVSKGTVARPLQNWHIAASRITHVGLKSNVLCVQLQIALLEFRPSAAKSGEVVAQGSSPHLDRFRPVVHSAGHEQAIFVC